MATCVVVPRVVTGCGRCTGWMRTCDMAKVSRKIRCAGLCHFGDGFGFTPAHVAAQEGQVEALRLLLSPEVGAAKGQPCVSSLLSFVQNGAAHPCPPRA